MKNTQNYKSYKAGKFWLTAGVSALGLTVGLATITGVNADSVAPAPTDDESSAAQETAAPTQSSQVTLPSSTTTTTSTAPATRPTTTNAAATPDNSSKAKAADITVGNTDTNNQPYSKDTSIPVTVAIDGKGQTYQKGDQIKVWFDNQNNQAATFVGGDSAVLNAPSTGSFAVLPDSSGFTYTFNQDTTATDPLAVQTLITVKPGSYYDEAIHLNATYTSVADGKSLPLTTTNAALAIGTPDDNPATIASSTATSTTASQAASTSAAKSAAASTSTSASAAASTAKSQANTNILSASGSLAGSTAASTSGSVAGSTAASTSASTSGSVAGSLGASTSASQSAADAGKPVKDHHKPGKHHDHKPGEGKPEPAKFDRHHHGHKAPKSASALPDTAKTANNNQAAEAAALLGLGASAATYAFFTKKRKDV
ncbi:KxYKxGKxW signal peptide domain-containing protein [Lactobacillaceae bacterium L1_55_11]|nr:KxYKxGKxW signal peptide domain-containing protein [Lactobacillaceae bacterium L1_55_11]